jgi:hypothetical protein
MGTTFITPQGSQTMLTTIAIVLIVLWALGFFGGFVASGLVHALLVIALVMIILQFVSGRRVA